MSFWRRVLVEFLYWCFVFALIAAIPGLLFLIFRNLWR